mmetsp:Transcript_64219/g.206870  ORF Transcript_64219/g.206870 Transcript_64219/m.206870 type:complete len:587 (-) Transcript_64219:118-1878(-)
MAQAPAPGRAGPPPPPVPGGMPGGAAAARAHKRRSGGVSKTASTRTARSNKSEEDGVTHKSSTDTTETYAGDKRQSPFRRSSKTTPVFIDTEEMKDRIKQSLVSPSYNVTDFYHEEGLWQKIARHTAFEHTTLLVIMVNAVWIAVDTDYNKAPSLLEAEPLFQIVEHFFCVYFAFEWCVRFMAFKWKRDGLKDRWFVFDSCLVFMMVMETWVMLTVQILLGSGGTGGLGNASILRLFRLMRLSRLARMLRSMPELMILIKGMLSAMRSVGFVMGLLVVIMYIFAIAFTQLAKGSEMGADFFSSVTESMYSLLIFGVFLDSLEFICTRIGNENTLCLVLFFVFVLLAALTVMNMLIGVLCEVVSAVADVEREDMLLGFTMRKMQAILEQIDDNSDFQISKHELMAVLERAEACSVLQEVGVDPVGLVDMADEIFGDEFDGVISFPEFMDVILKLRGTNTATVKDFVDLRKAVFGAFSELQAFVQREFQRARTREFSNRSWTQGSDPDLQEALLKLQGRTAYAEGLLGTALREVQALSKRCSQRTRSPPPRSPAMPMLPSSATRNQRGHAWGGYGPTTPPGGLEELSW